MAPVSFRVPRDGARTQRDAFRCKQMLQVTPEQGNGKYDRKHIRKAAPAFGDWLKDRMAGGFGTATLDITPNMAADMLAYNDNNRPLRKAHAQALARQMAEGRWVFTGEPVIFSDSGRMIDGQHRLTACNQSGVTVKMTLTFGVPDRAFAHINVGAKRGASDIFAINGVKNAALLSSAVHWVLLIESRDRLRIRTAFGTSAAELYEAYLAHAAIEGSVWVASSFKKNRLASPSMMVALHYVCAQKCRRDADEFFRRVGEGVGIAGKKDPAHRLREALIRNATTDAKMSRVTLAAIVLKAWNAFRGGRPVALLRLGDDEPFPAAR